TTMYPTMTRPGSSPYGPSKAALECATEIWHKDLEGTGVTVNILNPGAGAATPGMAEEMKQMSREAKTPILIEPVLYKAPIVWLMSDATDGISGMRYDAKPWDASKPAAQEGERIGAKAGVLLYAMPDC
ncbi:MAG: SDR family NAD(P)-dependent oxidoreductase, partial [Alphaproteobacteria bacterium]|nr:SDR family NAD(P)-dependent oxidoreductase [Alphaproteobacteria bacterium]